MRRLPPETGTPRAAPEGGHPPSLVRPLSGWGNYPVQRCRLYRPEQRRELVSVVRRGGTLIARGAGRSYGDAALDPEGAVVLTTRLNRFISFDPEAGVVACEGGVTLAELIEHLLPRGYFPPVTPGTKFVTVGGAIANDVHGKNHHADGSIAGFVLDFDLLTAGGEILPCSRSENADLFWATIGGLGLTGVIVRARVRLLPVETARVAAAYLRTRDLDEALTALDRTDAAHRYSVAWIDCLSGGRALGRSVVIGGDHATRGEIGDGAAGSILRAAPAQPRRSIPFFLPGWALGKPAARAFNAHYYRRHGPRATLLDYDAFFYPLDGVGAWNRAYGRRGFIQCQVAFPSGTSRDGIAALLETLARSRRAAFLGVLKRLGPPSGGLLSFPIEGHTLALDIPATPGTATFMRGVHDLILRHGGRVYLAKDATLTPEAFRAMYPRLRAFLAVKRRVDPDGVFSSSMARRLGIVGTGS